MILTQSKHNLVVLNEAVSMFGKNVSIVTGVTTEFKLALAKY